jgi:N-acetylmuramoyl-L-alanine amidase
VAGAAVFELALDAAAAGFRLERDTARSRVRLEIAAVPAADLERFAAETHTGPRPLRVIVLDPGHGGDDAGVRAGTLVEKELTLRLARMLAQELERRLGCRVLLTRDDDRAVAQAQRAEAANRARADLVLALHFDGFPSPQAQGVRLWVPPATEAAELPGPVAPLRLTAWRDAARRYAVDSRALAEGLGEALERRGHGPVRVRERLPLPLIGVHAPGLLLECGVLTHAGTRERFDSDEELRAFASLVADAVWAWQRGA